MHARQKRIDIAVNFRAIGLSRQLLAYYRELPVFHGIQHADEPDGIRSDIYVRLALLLRQNERCGL